MNRIKGKYTNFEIQERLMPAASHVYRMANVQGKFDSGRSRTFNFTISFLHTYNTSGIVWIAKKCRFCFKLYICRYGGRTWQSNPLLQDEPH
ncbi:hypothetical protein GM418_05875 [Maribellus comscasis]|uniref:Uncharacterized protein n=1 Tax=Maribellus comscasis TaxID=2681766 RepID=A0A6I6JZX6_9BACT|nr:hypothetical protein [Maribellus comscasis]QGY43204.1 hypothetical protein GM418_05875 [Maribellus comscasis]